MHKRTMTIQLKNLGNRITVNRRSNEDPASNETTFSQVRHVSRDRRLMTELIGHTARLRAVSAVRIFKHIGIS